MPLIGYDPAEKGSRGPRKKKFETWIYYIGLQTPDLALFHFSLKTGMKNSRPDERH
jgi:hypothetical protein